MEGLRVDWSSKARLGCRVEGFPCSRVCQEGLESRSCCGTSRDSRLGFGITAKHAFMAWGPATESDVCRGLRRNAKFLINLRSARKNTQHSGPRITPHPTSATPTSMSGLLLLYSEAATTKKTSRYPELCSYCCLLPRSQSEGNAAIHASRNPKPQTLN